MRFYFNEVFCEKPHLQSVFISYCIVYILRSTLLLFNLYLLRVKQLQCQALLSKQALFYKIIYMYVNDIFNIFYKAILQTYLESIYKTTYIYSTLQK